jgi:hypothetical protein
VLFDDADQAAAAAHRELARSTRVWPADVRHRRTRPSAGRPDRGDGATRPDEEGKAA